MQIDFCVDENYPAINNYKTEGKYSKQRFRK